MRLALDQFVLTHRAAKTPLSPFHAYASVWEEEPDASRALAPTGVIFLTNRECPFRCVMCDLWTHTLDETVPPGAIPAQIREALSRLAPIRQVKLYNAGSYFDPRAIPPEDDEAVAREVDACTRVIVESHPAFLTGAHAKRCLRFRDLLSGQLEVAIGLETAHPGALARLNKQMTIGTFRDAADFLAEHDIALRVFVLLGPPYVPAADAVEWACRSIELAAECGATACTVIPTRGGNGAMEAIGDEFTPPRLRDLEAAVEHGLIRASGASRVSGMRVFADLWDIERFFDCGCAGHRAARLRVMNREQRVPPRVVCACDARH
jgi:radical SAM enzyme (TIGR01210 family)